MRAAREESPGQNRPTSGTCGGAVGEVCRHAAY